MKWLLVQAAYRFNVGFPLSLAQVATILEEQGYTVKCIDGSTCTLDHILQETKKWNPDIFGISSTSLSIQYVFRLASKIKKMRPNLPVIVGGALAKLEYYKLLSRGPIDFCCVTDIEHCLTNQKCQTVEEIGKLPGIASISSAGAISINSLVETVEFSLTPFPKREIGSLSIRNYNTASEVMDNAVALLSTKGCPYSCSYCASKDISGQQVQSRSVANVKQEIDYLLSLGYRAFVFEDYEFLHDRERAQIIARYLGQNNAKWIIKARLESLKDIHLCKDMKENGCKMAYVGLETLTAEASLRAGKPFWGIEDLEQTIQTIHSSGLALCVSIQFGLPGDTIDDFITGTINILPSLLDQERDLVQLHFTTLFPGTEVYQLMAKTARLVNLHDEFSDIIAHGLDGLVPGCLSDHTIRYVIEVARKKLGKLLTKKAIW